MSKLIYRYNPSMGGQQTAARQGGARLGAEVRVRPCLHPSPCQSVSHSRHGHLAHSTDGPEMGAHTQRTHGATWERRKTGKQPQKCKETNERGGEIRKDRWNDSEEKTETNCVYINGETMIYIIGRQCCG